MAGGFLDQLLNIVIPIAALLFFGAVMYRNPAIREIVNIVKDWIASMFSKVKNKGEEQYDEFYKPR